MIKKLLYFLVPVIIIITIYSLQSDESETAYRQQVADKRSERIRFLKHSEQSPFQKFEIQYRPLEFFPVDSKYKVRGNLERFSTKSRLTIQNSDGSSASYLKYAYASFKIDGQPLKLLILKPTGFGALPDTYFTAFADQTSGETSYGGGRYLDLEIGKSDNIEIDFNLAYNPYCAYTKEYTCPLPPAENLLPVPILAGEKDYKK